MRFVKIYIRIHIFDHFVFRICIVQIWSILPILLAYRSSFGEERIRNQKCTLLAG